MPLIQWIMQNLAGGSRTITGSAFVSSDSVFTNSAFPSAECQDMTQIGGRCGSVYLSIGDNPDSPSTCYRSGSSNCNDNVTISGCCATYHRDAEYLSEDHPGKIGVTMTACWCPTTIQVGIAGQIIDDTCGCAPSLVADGGAVVQDPLYSSEECENKCCEREKDKDRCLILKLRTGNPAEPQPQYCESPSC